MRVNKGKMKKSQITLVIPARNEENVIIKTIKRIENEIEVLYSIVVVDDGSSDSTFKVVNDYSRKNKKVALIRNKGRHGFASALKSGFSKAKTEYVIPVMADLCDDPRTINTMYKLAQEDKADIVCGSRYMPGGSKIGGPMLQGFMSMLVCKSLRVFTGVQTWDVSNAFKLYRKSFLNKIRFNLESGVEISMELTLQAFFKGAKIAELPTSWKGRTVGKSKFNILRSTPRYTRIYFWALENTVRKKLNLGFKKFYA